MRQVFYENMGETFRKKIELDSNTHSLLFTLLHQRFQFDQLFFVHGKHDLIHYTLVQQFRKLLFWQH